ncbi:hypothetical protein [Hyphomonas sp.]|jgi:hypothetical protein|uniref:hypothetical protein n=1 Tax=Hyphomonas sp. TaxID=87 RepID=UPI0037C038F0
MEVQNILNQITELTNEWYSLIGKDHHKDRDCHFYINTVWSYGKKQKYRVEHYGYIFRDVEEEFDTYNEAAMFLLNKIKEMIKVVEEEDQEIP